MKTFTSMDEFAAFWATRVEAAQRAQATGLRDAAELIQETAREKIGHYQPAEGPFEAWQPLAESTLEGFTDRHGHHPGKVELGFAPPDNPLLRTGELRDAIGISYGANKAVVGVEHRQVGDGSAEDPTRDIGEVAIWQEMGDEKMPPRSFLGAAAFSEGKEAARIVGRAVADAIAGIPYPYRPPHGGTPPNADSEIPF